MFFSLGKNTPRVQVFGVGDKLRETSFRMMLVPEFDDDHDLEVSENIISKFRETSLRLLLVLDLDDDHSLEALLSEETISLSRARQA